MNIATSFDSLHLMANLHGCDGTTSLMRDVATLRTSCLQWVMETKLVAVGECFHQFDDGGGVTGVVVLAESHLSVHTWPEKSFVFVSEPITATRALDSSSSSPKNWPSSRRIAWILNMLGRIPST